MSATTVREHEPLPLPALVAVTVVSVATSAFFAAAGDDLDANLGAFVIAGCGTPTLVAGARYLTGREPANELDMASIAVRWLVFAFVALAAVVAAALGGAPEDAAIGASPLIFVAGDWEAVLRGTTSSEAA